MPKLKEKIALYMEAGSLTETEAKSTLDQIEIWRAQQHELDLHAAAAAAHNPLSLNSACLDPAALAALLSEREAQMQTQPSSVEVSTASCTDQWRIYQFVTNALMRDSEKPIRLLVQASAGTGKSFLLSTIYLWCLVRRKHICAFAPTGIAAANIVVQGTPVCATTYHHLFGLTAELDGKMDANKASDPYVRKLSATDIFLGDEVSMLDTDAWNTIQAKIAAVERWRHQRFRATLMEAAAHVHTHGSNPHHGCKPVVFNSALDR